jgi:hypothetical protein
MTMDEQCKYDSVPSRGKFHLFRRCENNAKLDGFCMTHHPDKVKLRHQKSAQLWKERHDNTRTVRLVTLRKLECRIAELEAEPARLQEILLRQTKLNTKVIKEKMELESAIRKHKQGVDEMYGPVHTDEDFELYATLEAGA